MKIIDAYEGVGNGLVIFNDSFYHIKPYGDVEYRSLYKGSDEKIHGNVSHFFCADGKIFFNEHSVNNCYLYADGRTELLSNKFRVSRKVGNVFETCVSNPPYTNSIYDQAFNFITNISEAYLQYSDENIYIVSDDKQFRCHEYSNNNLSWVFDLNSIGTCIIGTGYDKREEQVRTRTVIGHCQGVLIMSTNCEWLIGLDIKSGNQVWLLKQIPNVIMNKYQEAQMIYGAHKYKVDDSKGMIYCYYRNIYTEVDVLTGTVVYTLDQNKENVPDLGYDDPYLQYDMAPTVKLDNILYYSSYDRDPIKDENRKGAAVRVIGINTENGDIVKEFKFSRKESKKFYGFRDFQYADGKFYCLGRNNTLYVLSED